MNKQNNINNYLCNCGCENQIEIKKHHKYYGIPKYISGHQLKNINIKHNESKTRLYRIWKSMKSRCLNTNRKKYQNYGGRGITICPEWTESYIVFRDWALNNDYSEELQINRIENDGNYEPNNCNWVTIKENTRNTSHCKITLKIANEIRELYKTDLYTYKELSKKYNVSFSLIEKIIRLKIWID